MVWMKTLDLFKDWSCMWHKSSLVPWRNEVEDVFTSRAWSTPGKHSCCGIQRNSPRQVIWSILVTRLNNPIWKIFVRTKRVSSHEFNRLLRGVALWTLCKNHHPVVCTWNIILSELKKDPWTQVRFDKRTDLKSERFAVFESSRFITTRRWSSSDTVFDLLFRASTSLFSLSSLVKAIS